MHFLYEIGLTMRAMTKRDEPSQLQRGTHEAAAGEEGEGLAKGVQQLGVIDIVWVRVSCPCPCLPGVQQRNATLRRKRVRAEKIALYAIYVQISSMILKEDGGVGEWERKQPRWGQYSMQSLKMPL